MKVSALEAEKQVIELVGRLRSEGLTFTVISDRLNAEGFKTSWTTPWGKQTVRNLWARCFDPESALQRVDTADSMLQLSLRCLEIVAAGTGRQAEEAANALYVYHSARLAGISVAEACALAKRILLEERAERRQEAK